MTPAKPTVAVLVSMPPDLYEWLSKKAGKRGRSPFIVALLEAAQEEDK